MATLAGGQSLNQRPALSSPNIHPFTTRVTLSHVLVLIIVRRGWGRGRGRGSGLCRRGGALDFGRVLEEECLPVQAATRHV